MNRLQTIGIIGGGQLGMMMCEAALNMGYDCVVLDPNANCSASKVCANIVVAPFDDYSGYEKLAKQCNWITYEFENVPYHLVKKLMNEGFNVPQGEQPLYITQHRLREKNAIRDAGFITVPYWKVESLADLKAIVQQNSNEYILKTCFGGYDGKGQWRINSLQDVNDISPIFEQKIELILEQKITLKQEISCIVHRNKNGETVSQPIFENVHKDGILHYSCIPAKINDETCMQAKEIAETLMQKLDFTGTLAVEMFLDTNDNIYINELAPRPHNSGHLSIEACDFSQFSCHILAITNQHLPEPKMLQKALMLNVIGNEYANAEEKYSSGFFHDYFKTTQDKRKMAHVTFLGEHSEIAKELYI